MRLTWAILTAVFMLIAGATWGSSQSAKRVLPRSVVAGDDIGFRVMGHVGQNRVGRFVVRIDGQWYEGGDVIELKPLTAK